jgi:hypothetical protein
MYYIFGIIILIILGNCLIKRYILLKDIDICINQCNKLQESLILEKTTLDNKYKGEK